MFYNSQEAIRNNVYDVSGGLERSSQDLLQIIKTNLHPTLITEVKFSSPSLGKIRTISDPVSIAKKMIKGGAKALSILTQPYLFNGSPSLFMEIRKEIKVPLLMKDIIIDKVQIDAADKIGADFILLIQSLFDKGYIDNVDEFVAYGHRKKIKVLLEVHTKEEFERALQTDADLIGINNRDLDTLNIDLKTTANVLAEYKGDRPIISESGIETKEDIQYLKRCGAKAFLVGTSIMKSDDITGRVKELVNAY